SSRATRPCASSTATIRSRSTTRAATGPGCGRRSSPVRGCTEVRPTADLTPKQERFCREYLIDLNATQAAIRAGYAEGSAKVTASRLLSNANVAARLAQLQEKTARKLEISAETVARELALLAFAN